MKTPEDRDTTIKTVTYEEARLSYFIAQRKSAANSLKYWARKWRISGSAYNPTYLVNVENAADVWNYYNDVIGLLGGPKEATP